MQSVLTILALLALSGLLVAAVTDVKARIIQNRVVIAVAVLGLALQVASRGATAWVSIAAAIAIFLPLAVLAEAKIFGGGDAKLIAAASLLVAPQNVVALLINISLAGGLMSCAYIVAHALKNPNALFLSRTGGGSATEHGSAIPGDGALMPYAVAIFAGATYSILTEVLTCSSATSCLS